jgi:hypothetical protein
MLSFSQVVLSWLLVMVYLLGVYIYTKLPKNPGSDGYSSADYSSNRIKILSKFYYLFSFSLTQAIVLFLITYSFSHLT